MRAAYLTYGCKVNSCETASVTVLMEKNGFITVSDPAGADVIVINSCTVTANGDRKVRQAVRSVRRSNPEAVIVLCGCFPQAFPSEAGTIKEADIIVGNRSRTHLPSLIHEHLQNRTRIFDIENHTKDEPFEVLPCGKLSDHTRGFLKIEDGCERWCSYCIIPRARGNVRSLSPEAITQQCMQLAAQGFKEIVLTGINLSAYGNEIGLTIADAVEAAAKAPGISRIRLGSLEPDLLGGDILPRLRSVSSFCAHFHIALQSGCDRTLARMRRHYTTEEFSETAARIRSCFDRPVFTTDVIVGFPGETDEDFKESVRYILNFGFARCHVFPFSVRPGTLASKMTDQIPRSQKESRAKIMREAAEKSSEKVLYSYIGLRDSVIAETPEGEFWTGYTSRYLPALLPKEHYKQGDLVTGIITDVQDGRCLIK